MAEKFFPFGSINRDRVYFAEDWRRYFGSLISNGVFWTKSDVLQVTTDGIGMQVNIADGNANINGGLYSVEGGHSLTLPTADGTYNRIDAIVLQYGRKERWIKAIVKEGEAAETPNPPELERSTDYWELCLAEVTVERASLQLSQKNIKDMRLSGKCGIVVGLIQQIETETIYAQLTAAIEAMQITAEDNIVAWQQERRTEIENWFENIRDKLSEDPAGQLQNEVEALAQAAFNRYYGLANQTTEFMPDGSIVQSNGEATITTTFGYDAEGHRQIRQVLTVDGSGDTYTKLTTVYEATADENKRIVEEYTGTSAGGIYDPGTGTWTFKLPVAGLETLGGIKVGEGLAISEDGTLSVDTGAAEEETVRILGERLVDFDPKEVTDMFDDGGEE